MRKLTQHQEQVLSAIPKDRPRASWGIADQLHQETHWIYSTLRALEKKGAIRCVERGGNGKAAFWQRVSNWCPEC